MSIADDAALTQLRTKLQSPRQWTRTLRGAHTALMAVAMFALWLPAPLAAQGGRSDRQANAGAAARAIEAATDDAISATRASPSDAELEADHRADEVTIKNAMTQLAGSPDAPLAEQLPQPEFVSNEDIVATLGYSTAWKDPTRKNHEDEDYKNVVVELVRYGAWVYFDEWSCNTGGEATIARQMIDLLHSLVTRYPERLMLRAMLQERELRGYPKSKSCDRDELVAQRNAYQKRLSVVLDRI